MIYASRTVKAAAVVIATLFVTPAIAYPEFQAYAQKHSGMGVSCAMCHISPDGPEGAGPGQIGGLDASAQQQLNEARASFEPGHKVSSPILNAFGNDIVRQLGRKKVIELKQSPADLATALDQKSDLDDDGAPDAREYLDGTHPLSKSSGNPWLLASHNLKKHWFSIVMVFLATISILYGLRNIHRALEIKPSSDL
jgi:hypothetical protein